MNNVIVGVIGYSSAAGIFFILATILLAGRSGLSFKRFLAFASVASTIWAAAAALQAWFYAALLIPQILEVARDFAWLAFLLHILNVRHDNHGTTSTGFRIARHAVYIFTAVTILLALYRYYGGSAQSFFGEFDYQLASHLLLAVIGLVLLEQILRNTPLELLRAIKYLCLGIGGIFAYDFYLYSDALLFQRIDPALWEARGFINASVVPVLGIALARNPQWSPHLFISRRVIFHTSALLGSGIYLLAMGIGGYYVRDYGGTWGVVAQTIFLFGAGLILLVLLFSGPLRARLRVFINKHFFHYKYDYREEWLRFIRTLSSSDQDVPLPERVIRAIAQMMDCPSGALWVRRENGWYEPEAQWNMTLSISISEPAGSSLARFLEIQKWVINLDEYQRDPGLYRSLGDLEMPEWLNAIPNAWLISPLILHENLMGFVVLARSAASHRHFNWEDCDLLKTSGSQAASYLSQHAISQALAEARQFEAFNRLSTYVVHDLKNLISQLSLVVSNAARHKNNPLFMDNVISTVGNSVEKMNRLLARMKSEATVAATPMRAVDLEKLLEEVVRDAQAARPAPVFECKTRGGVTVAADHDQLASVMGHVVRNAQDATPEDGHVVVRMQKVNGHAVVEVEDTGCGMDEAFIRARLFRPFQTTKGTSGMGIGVYEARELVRSLGGDIDVQSKPGEGTIFRIHLPYQTAVTEPQRFRKNL